MQNSDINTKIFLKNDQKSHELLYKYFAPKMYGICLRFAGNEMEADDILQEGFIKIFIKIKEFSSIGTDWIIIVRNIWWVGWKWVFYISIYGYSISF